MLLVWRTDKFRRLPKMSQSLASSELPDHGVVAAATPQDYRLRSFDSLHNWYKAVKRTQRDRDLGGDGLDL